MTQATIIGHINAPSAANPPAYRPRRCPVGGKRKNLPSQQDCDACKQPCPFANTVKDGRWRCGEGGNYAS
ncbi:MAG: hypothetical protein OEV73_00270 [Desulfobulbaceae bacterium]|nr:hypothetical protein [Desulfobulbaceae bacterium]